MEVRTLRIYSDDPQSVEQSLAESGLRYNISRVHTFSKGGGSHWSATVMDSAATLARYVRRMLADREVVVYTDRGPLKVRGYSQEETVLILEKCNELFISKETSDGRSDETERGE